MPYPGANSQQPSVMMPGLASASMPPPPPPTVGFMPVSTPSNQAVAAQEPPSPQAGSSNSSSASFAPASTVQTADTSNVAGDSSFVLFGSIEKYILQSLRSHVSVNVIQQSV